MPLAESAKTALLGALVSKAPTKETAPDVDDAKEARGSHMRELADALKGERWDDASEALENAFQEWQAARSK